jgi:hypothetical protein
MAIGIAIIGSGIFVKEEHLPAVQAVPELVTVKAIYSRSLKSAKAVSEDLSDVDLYSDDSEGKTLDDLLKRDDIKGVIIAFVYASTLSRSKTNNSNPVFPSPTSQNTSRKHLRPGNTCSLRSLSQRTLPQHRTFSHGLRTLPTPAPNTQSPKTSASSTPSFTAPKQSPH